MKEMSVKSNGSDLLAEYFAVCGLPDEPTLYDVSEILANGEEIVLSESRCLDFSRYCTPIIDIQLVNVSQCEKVPEGYQLINKTINGSDCSFQSRTGDKLCICYRRGYDKPPVGDIGLVDTDQNLKANSSNISHTIENRSAVLLKKRFLPSSNMCLSYSRLPKNYGVDQLALTDICVIIKNKGERCPLGYKELPQKLVQGSLVSDMHICYKKSFVKRYIATYQPEVLMWYSVPSFDSSPLRTNQHADLRAVDEVPNAPIFNSVDISTLANFCLPWGAAIESWSVEQNPPRSVFFTFVVTNASYQRFHGSALTFYEPYDIPRLDRDRCYRLDVDPELALLENCEEDLFTPAELLAIKNRQGAFAASRVGDRVLGVTKTLCLMSRFNFGNAFRPFLSFLESRCFAPEARSIPLERYLAFMLYEIPFPGHLCSSVTVDLDGYYMRLQTPLESRIRSASSSGEPYANLLYRIGSELCLQLIIQLLTEQKLLLVSIMPDFLVDTIQQITTLIHPLRWVLVYIPLIHMRCIHVIQSPSPYLIGVDSRFFEFFQLPPDEDITVVDLDTRLFRPAATNAFADAKCLPKGPYKRLKASLMEGEKQLWAMERKTLEAKSTPRCGEEFRTKLNLIGTRMRQACYTFMADLLQDYRRYLLPATSAKPKILFATDEFVKHAPQDRTAQPFYRALVKTQLWADFVRDLNRISARTAELEFFDNSIAQFKPQRNRHGHYSSSGRGTQEGFAGGENSSQVSGSSDGSASWTPQRRSHSALSMPTNGGAGSESLGSPRGSLAGNLDDISLNGCLIGIDSGLDFHGEYSTRVIEPPSEVLEMDPLCTDLPLDGFTWTEVGRFPCSINAPLLDQLCSRAASDSRGPLHAATAVVAAKDPPNMSPVSPFSLTAACSEALSPHLHGEEFSPPMVRVAKPLGFIQGNGVPEAFGIGKLNFLIKRTQQETTNCLIVATTRCDLGGHQWAELLLSEVYSLWFLLLPAFISSLQQHFDGLASDICTEARHFLFHVVGLFLRLWDSVLRPVDQAFVRVLISLLYEYGTSDQGVVNFWSSRPLNATSYAMANQLQRDLGHKLTSARTNPDCEGEPATEVLPAATAITVEDVDEGLSAFVPGRQGGGETSLPLGYLSPPIQTTDSQPEISMVSDDGGAHSASQLTVSNGTPSEAEVEAVPVSKKGWKAFAQASMRKLASLTVEYQNPDLFNLDIQDVPLVGTPQRHGNPPRVESPSSHDRLVNGGTATRSIGYGSLFGQPGSSTRLPRNMRPWAVPLETPDTGDVTRPRRLDGVSHQDTNLPQQQQQQQQQLTSSSSWLQFLQQHLPTPMSPASSSRRPASGETLVGSTTPFDENAGATTIAGGTVSPFDGQISEISYQPPSWHAIAGPLAVGSPGDRVCLVNPLVMRSPPPVVRSPSASRGRESPRRSRSSSLAANVQGLSPLPLLHSTSEGGREEEEDNHCIVPPLRPSPSASTPLLNTLSMDSPDQCEKTHPRSQSPRCSKPPLPRGLIRGVEQMSTPHGRLPVVQELRVIFTTCTPCLSCLRVVYDEEVMAAWNVTVGDPSTITCPACRLPFSPKLTVRTVAILEVPAGRDRSASRASRGPPTNQSPPLSHGLIEYSLPYLSPLILRRHVEAMLSSTGFQDCMAAEALSSTSLLLRRTVLLWNLVYYFHRAGLPTHLLDSFAAWLIDAQEEARRLGGGRRVFFGGSLTVAKALSEVELTPDLPVCLVARWDAFPRKGAPKNASPLSIYRHWVNLSSNNASFGACMSASTSLADLAATTTTTTTTSREENPRACVLDEIVQMMGDALLYENFGGAITAALQGLNSSPLSGSVHSASLGTGNSFTVYRELLMMYTRIHGVSRENFKRFDLAYLEFLRGKSDNNQLQNLKNDLPSHTVMACRCVFRNLVLS